MARMRQWELRCLQRVKSDDWSSTESKKLGLAEYGDIFRECCSAERATPRESLHFSDPPGFDPDREPIESIEFLPDGTVEVRTTQEFKFKYQFVYRFVNEDGEWKLFQRLRVGPAGALREKDL